MEQLGRGHSEEFIKRRKEQERRIREKRRKLRLAAGAAAVVLGCVGAIAGVSAAALSSGKKDAKKEPSETVQADAEKTTQSAETSAESAAETTIEEETTPTIAQNVQVPDGAKIVYLTFDDGPSEITTQLLDVLDTCNVKATFFVVGKRVEMYPDQTNDIISRGHAVGLHSYDHDYHNVYASLECFADSTLQAQAALQEVTGTTTLLYRFPGGTSNSVHKEISDISMTACINWLTENGFTYVDWNVDSGDAEGVDYSGDEIAQHVIDGTDGYSRAVVLMHNDVRKDATVEAIPKIVDTLRSEGYTFDTLKPGDPVVHHHAQD